MGDRHNSPRDSKKAYSQMRISQALINIAPGAKQESYQEVHTSHIRVLWYSNPGEGLAI